MCQVLELRESSYYQWKRGEKRRQEKAKDERGLVEKVRKVFADTKQIYGCRRLRAALADEEIELSEWQVRRIMRENGLYPESVKKYKPAKGSKGDGRTYENELKQDFTSPEPNRKWVGDITYLKTKLGWVYLAVVMDLYNREIVGYSVRRDIRMTTAVWKASSRV